MSILFFSDVHGSEAALQVLARRIQELAPVQLVLLGDCLYHGPRNPLQPGYDPAAAAAILNRWKNIIIAVRGNCDAEVDQAMLEFPIQGEYATLLLGRLKILLNHGCRWNSGTPPPLGTADILAYGHTHIPDLQRLPDGLVCFNPGSIALPRGGHPASFGWLEGNRLQIRALHQPAQIMQELCLEPAT